MKIISWNTNGLRATIKQGYFEPLFEKYDPDILCLQETKANEDQIALEIRNHKKYFSYFSSSIVKKGYSGVAIYTRKKPKEVFFGMGKAGGDKKMQKFDDEGRIVGVKFDEFTLINIYFPNGGQGPERLKYKLEFYDAFLKFILRLRKKGEKIIFCGDVNTAHRAIDLARPKENEENTGFLPVERAWLDKVESEGFMDVFRHFYPNVRDAYTYWDMKTFARDRNVGWRIDYFFTSPHLLLKVKSTKILADYYGSDHCPIELELEA